MKNVLLKLLLLLAHSCLAQTDIPCIACDISLEGLRLIRHDSTGDYLTNHDTSAIIRIAERSIYQHFDKDMHLIIEGNLGGRVYTDYFQRFGQWTWYYKNGKPKVSGCYYEDEPMGLWKLYYDSGQLKQTYNIIYVQAMDISGYCMAGAYQDYYPNGHLKTDGFYKAMLDSVTVLQVNPVTSEESTKKVPGFVAKKYGLWYYYTPNGTIEKMTDYKH